MKKILDLSKYNEIIDIEKLLSKNNLDGIILRSSIGIPEFGPNTYGTDTKFIERYNELVNRIPLGVYHFAKAETVEEAIKEADYVYSIIKDKKLELPIYYDIEEQKHSLNPQLTSKMIEAFCEYLENKGYFVGFTTFKSLYDRLDKSIVDKYSLWLAWYTNEEFTKNLPKQTAMHQYTSTGNVEGVRGYVDLSTMYEDLIDIIRKNGLNHLSEIEQKENNIKYEYIDYIVQTGDYLSKIGQKFGVAWNIIYEDNKEIIGANPDLIYTGQKLKIRKEVK